MVRPKLESVGGFDVYTGDALRYLPQFAGDTFDAVVTDPPYSSGGFTRGDRTLPVSTKYVRTDTERFRGEDFDGDNRDQRSFAHWCQLWMSDCLRVTKPGGFFLCFTDWRQLPTVTDAFQAAGWVWRGLIDWNKGPAARASAPHYFRHQCEYVVWGTRGPCKGYKNWPAPGRGCLPGSYTHFVNQADKQHVTGKPFALMCELLQFAPAGAHVLDPFCGSGTTLAAAAKRRQTGVGIELDPKHARTAVRRVRDVLFA